MIDAHLRPIQLGQTPGGPTKRAIYKFFRDTQDAGIDTLFLSLADHLATVGPRVSREGFRAHVELTGYILRIRFVEERVVYPPKLANGDDLMEAFGLEPGPLLGELLEALREATAAGEVDTRDQALALAGRLLAAKRAAAPQ
jgi:poly(A) polymerase